MGDVGVGHDGELGEGDCDYSCEVSQWLDLTIS